jgi:predicted nucleotidyltransferase
MNFDLQSRTIFLTVAGSQSYGMATPTSDYDYRGIAIPPLKSYTSILHKFEQCVDTDKGKHVYKHYNTGLLSDDPRITGDESKAPDMQVFELSKFIRLALDNNPSVLEVLFTDPKFHVIKHPLLDRILEKKELLLSKQVKARYCGYALSQLNRIKLHRRYLLNPPDHKPTRSEFNLPEYTLIGADHLGAAESLIQKELDEFMIEQTHLPEDVKIELNLAMSKTLRAVWKSINSEEEYPIGENGRFTSSEEALYFGVAKDQGFSENFIQTLACERAYRNAKRQWDQYQHWLKTRNPARAELEKKFGFDAKHASHLCRLLRTCREILETGKLNVLRPDADFLLSIRNGAWTYEQIAEFAEKEDNELNEVVKSCNLPKLPPIEMFHDLTHEIIMEFNNEQMATK